MKRLIRKASSNTFYHCTSVDKIESIMQQGLVPGNGGTGSYTGGNVSMLGGDGVYVSAGDYDFYHGGVVIEMQLDSNSMIPDPEVAIPTGVHFEDDGEYLELLAYIVKTPLFKKKYGKEMGMKDYDDIEEFIEDQEDEITDILYKNNFELIKMIKPGMFNYINAYVYLGTVSPGQFTAIHVKQDNDSQSSKDFAPNDIEGVVNYIKENGITDFQG